MVDIVIAYQKLTKDFEKASLEIKAFEEANNFNVATLDELHEKYQALELELDKAKIIIADYKQKSKDSESVATVNIEHTRQALQDNERLQLIIELMHEYGTDDKAMYKDERYPHVKVNDD